MKKQVDKFQIDKTTLETIIKGLEGFEKMREENRESYARQYRSLVAFLEKEGKIVPGDEKDFFDWYFNVKIEDDSMTAENMRRWATIEPHYFREFHEYKKSLFEGKVKPKEENTLPSLEEAYKGEVSELWRKLATMPRPLVSVSGEFIWEGQNVSVLMALAQALATADLIKDGHNIESVYRILCRNWKIEEAKRPRIRRAPDEWNLSNRFNDYLAEFNDVLRE